MNSQLVTSRPPKALSKWQYQKVRSVLFYFHPFLIRPGSVRLLVPRIEGEIHSIEPFDIFVSDVDILLESKPEGKVRPPFFMLLYWRPSSGWNRGHPLYNAYDCARRSKPIPMPGAFLSSSAQSGNLFAVLADVYAHLTCSSRHRSQSLSCCFLP